MRYRGWFHIILDLIIQVILSFLYLWIFQTNFLFFLNFLVGNVIFILESQYNLGCYYNALTMERFSGHEVVMGLQGAENIAVALIFPFFIVRMRVKKRLMDKEKYPNVVR